MKTDAAKRNEDLVAVALNFLLSLPMAAWRGWVISIAWGWFIVPLGVLPVGIWHAAGLSLAFTFIGYSFTKIEKNEPGTSMERLGWNLTVNILGGLLTLLFGAIYRAFAF